MQAEDGIRDIGVTGVQTCALPILGPGGAACRAQPQPPPRRRDAPRRLVDRARRHARRDAHDPPARPAREGRAGRGGGGGGPDGGVRRAGRREAPDCCVTLVNPVPVALPLAASAKVISTYEDRSPRAPRRAVLAGPLVAVAALATAFVVTQIAGVPLRDPDGVASGRLLGALGFVAALVCIDVLVRASRRSPRMLPSRADAWAVLRERWTRHRIIPLCMALFGFFATYFAYR